MHTMQNLAESPQANCFQRLPAEMRALPQWSVTVGTATDKTPRKADGQHASPTDPTTWMDFDTACRVAAERGWMIGFVFTANDPFACIDLDVVNEKTQAAKRQPIDPTKWTTPEQMERFTSIVQTFDSYTEVSRSGEGLHILLKGNIGKGRRRDGVEVYSQERFLICTGNIRGEARHVADRQTLLDNMVKQLLPVVQEVELSGDPDPDWALADRAATDAGELGRLFAGDWEGRYTSQSEADLALVKLLLPHAESTRECWETFRLSGLGRREKAKRPGYARSTIALALQHLANDAAQVQHGRALAEAMGLTNEQAQQKGFFWPVHDPAHFRVLRDGDLAQLPPLRWMVKRIIPDAGIGAIYGDSGTYKSFLTLDLLAHLANGRDWFGRKVKAAPAVYVPFEGQGGIPKRVDAWRLAQTQARLPEGQFAFAPAVDVQTNMGFIMESCSLRQQADRDKLVATMTAKGWAGGVLCIDTLAHASNGIDENSSEMGEMIGIFRDLQRQLGGVILIVHHSGKDQARGMRGWSGVHAAMDFILECRRNKKSGTTDAEFVLTKVKDGSDGLSFSFTMQTVVLGVDEDGEGITSLTVCPTGCEGEAGNASATKQTTKGINAIDAETAASDDRFIHQWVNAAVIAGKFPSKNSLKGQLPDMKETYEITQDRVLAAIERLIAAELLMVEKELKSPNGNVWIRPLDPPQVAE